MDAEDPRRRDAEFQALEYIEQAQDRLVITGGYFDEGERGRLLQLAERQLRSAKENVLQAQKETPAWPTCANG